MGKEGEPPKVVPFRKKEVLPLFDAVWLTGDLDDVAATTFISLIEHEAVDGDKIVTCVIKCDGGDERDLFSVRNHFNRIRQSYPGVKIRTIADGYANSTATALVALGDKGERISMPNTEFLIHDSWMPNEQLPDNPSWKQLRQKTLELRRAQRTLFKFLEEATGTPIKDFYAIASEKTFGEKDALALGIIDKIYQP